MPSPPPTVSRRHVLISAATLTLLGVTAPGCGSPPPPEVDELLAQLNRARADSQLATDAAVHADKTVAAALSAVAAERSAHAQALVDEMVRLRGDDAPTETPTSTTAQATQPPTAKDVVGALRVSAQSAAELAGTSSGYRAGLLASIAAACTASYTVALVFPEGTP